MRTALLLSSLPLAWAAFDCSSKLSLNGREFDLSSLAGVQRFEEQANTPPTVTKTKYELSLCSPLPRPPSDVPEGDACPAGTRLCMTTFTSRERLEDRLLSVVPIAGSASSDMDASATPIDGVDESQAWRLELTGGNYNQLDQRATIEMKCDPNAKETVPTVKEYRAKDGVLDLAWATSAACPTTKDSPPPERDPDDRNRGGRDEDDDDKTTSRGWGFFGWFFTLILLALVAYFVLGAYHNYTTYGATGWDMVPHRDMWRDLPWVLSDLVRPRGGSRSGYSSLG